MCFGSVQLALCTVAVCVCMHDRWWRATGCSPSLLHAVGMSGKYADRQEDELLFLREVFRSDLEDLREKDPWKASHVLSLCGVSLQQVLLCA